MLLARLTSGGLQPRVQFDTARLIDGKERATLRLNAAVEHVQHGLLRLEFKGEELIELPGAAHLELALAASALLLISPFILYYSRYIRHDIQVIAWTLLGIIAIFRYLENRRERDLTLLAVALALMLSTMEIAFIYMAMLAGYLVIRAIAQYKLDWRSLRRAAEFDLLVVSALLTLAGYSLTDKVVVYDRIRENLRKFRSKSEFIPCINRSINETMSRTINTSTTVLVVIVMAFLGGETLRNFAMALMLGVVIGTYSSIFVASPIIVEWEARSPRRFK